MPSSVPHALEFLSPQPRVRDLLAAALAEGKLSHAYLFLGAPGSGKTETALALAQCIVCPHGGDGTCDECLRVAHGTHPDVRVYRPASATGYLVEQVRELIADVALAPVRSSHKVYILEEVGTLRGTAANALLKTIEEPPEGIVFILIGRTAAAVMPTIVSRCQQVPFRVISTGAAERSLEVASGLSGSDARIALAVAGTPERAKEFLNSPDRQQVRRLMIRALGQLERADSWDVLRSAQDVVTAVKAPLASLKEAQEAALGESADFLAASALRKVEDANKRELSARERSGMMEALAAVESLLRDVLLQCEGVEEPMVNEDFSDVVNRIASSTTTSGVLDALEAVRTASNNLAHNVTPQLAIEAMLLSVKEALTCPPSSR